MLDELAVYDEVAKGNDVSGASIHVCKERSDDNAIREGEVERRKRTQPIVKSQIAIVVDKYGVIGGVQEVDCEIQWHPAWYASRGYCHGLSRACFVA